jgi:DNA-binding PadR family transcriptional regulator
MFGRDFAYQYQNAGGEDWTPPWLRRREERRGPFDGARGPRFFAMRRGRGPFGPGGPLPFGPGGEGQRFFGRGDMKFALLELLRERSMYGYEMIKALEEKAGGFYSPSPGSIYPTLQMLEERGFVTARDIEGKKVYSITDAGRALLDERQGGEERFAGPPWMRHRGHGGHRGQPGQAGSPEMQALRSEAMEVMRLLMIAGRMSFQNPGRLARLRAIIERTRKELAEMIYPSASQQEEAPAPSASQTDGPSVEKA